MDYSNFKPLTINEFVNGATAELKKLGAHWWEINSNVILGYLKSLGEATLETKKLFKDEMISAVESQHILEMHNMAFRSVIQFTKYKTLALAQKVFEVVTKLIGWAFYNHTGVNLFSV